MKTIIAIDGNSTGKILEKYILSNNVADLSAFSRKILSYIECLSEKIRKLNGNIFMSGGDNIIGEVDEQYIGEIIELLKRINTGEYNFSFSCADNLQSVYLGLKYAKSSRKKFIKAVMNADNELIFYEL